MTATLRREALFWVAIGIGALPLALLLARLGFAISVREPVVQVPMVILIAIAEEVVFRGGLQDFLARLGRRPMQLRFLGLSFPNLVTSAAFGATHLLAHSPAHALAVVPVSLLLGLARERSGGLLLPVALHAEFNLALYVASAMTL